jgi:glycerate 2-kinase
MGLMETVRRRERWHGKTLEMARAIGLDPAVAFRRSDAFTFFAHFEDVIVTGPTGNNLRDLRILIADP